MCILRKIIYVRVSEILKGKLFAILFDIASRQGKFFLGLTVQFTQNLEIKVYILVIIPMELTHIAENIRDLVVNRLNQ